jgi:ADP-ribosylglycohydrolase
MNGERLFGSVVEIDKYEKLRDQMAGVLLGAAVADALGWPTEFIKTESQARRLLGTNYVSDFRPWEKKTGGRFYTYIDYIQPGEYSDDTQLTLCTSRCIKADGSFDAVRFSKVELPHWLQYARGGGGTITRAARAISRRQAEWDNNFFEFESRGRKYDYTQAGANGGAMRISPHVLANLNNELFAMKGILQNVLITHGHPRAIWGGLLYGKCLLMLLSDRPKSIEHFLRDLESFAISLELRTIDSDLESWMSRWSKRSGQPFTSAFDQTRKEVLDFISIISESGTHPLEKTYEELGCFAPSTKGSGTATIAAAIAVFLKLGGDYERAVLKAVNMFGSDTDTIGSMVGAMIGASKGHIALPDRWVNVMQDYGYFIRTAEALTRIALRKATSNDLLVDHRREEVERRDRDIVSLAKTRRVHEGQRVTHPVFGLGWVVSVSSQQVRRRNGGTMLLARVAFDTGQTCIFRSYQGHGEGQSDVGNRESSKVSVESDTTPLGGPLHQAEVAHQSLQYRLIEH